MTDDRNIIIGIYTKLCNLFLTAVIEITLNYQFSGHASSLPVEYETSHVGQIVDKVEQLTDVVCDGKG